MKENIEFNYKTSFPPLGHPEHHFIKYPDHPWIKDKEEIYAWMKNNLYMYHSYSNKGKFDIKTITAGDCEDLIIINEDFTLTFNNDTQLKKPELNILCVEIINMISFIPIQFRFVEQLKSVENQIKSLIGIPYNSNNISISRSEIKDLNGVGNANIKALNLASNKITNFKGMSKKIEFLNMYNNPINSLDGFCSIEQLIWWQDEWCETTSLNFLMDISDKVSVILCDRKFESNLIIKEEDALDEINVDYLKQLKKIRNNNKSIENIFLKKENNNKKRKI